MEKFINIVVQAAVSAGRKYNVDHWSKLHDFMDANQILAAAWKSTMTEPLDPSNPDQILKFNEAMDAANVEMAQNMLYKVGDRVHWIDPDRDSPCDCDGKIISINGDIVTIETDSGGELEAPFHEITKIWGP